MSSEYRDIVERFAEGLSPQEFALFEQMTEEQRKDVMSRAGVLRDSMAQGGIINRRQGFYNGGGPGSQGPGGMGAEGYGGPMSDSSGNPAGGTGNGNGNGGGNGDPDPEGDDDDQNNGIMSTVGNFLSGLVTKENLVQAGLTAAFPGYGLLAGGLNMLANSPLGQYMGPYNESMVDPNPNGPDPVIATVDPMAEQAQQIAGITANYDSTQLSYFNDLVAQGYPENYAASVVSAMFG